MHVVQPPVIWPVRTNSGRATGGVHKRVVCLIRKITAVVPIPSNFRYVCIGICIDDVLSAVKRCRRTRPARILPLCLSRQIENTSRLQPQYTEEGISIDRHRTRPARTGRRATDHIIRHLFHGPRSIAHCIGESTRISPHHKLPLTLSRLEDPNPKSFRMCDRMQRFVGVSTQLAARASHRKRSRLNIPQHKFLRLVFIRPPARRHCVQISDWIACSRSPARQVDHHVKLLARKRPMRIVRRIPRRNHRRGNLRSSPLSGPPTSERIAFSCHLRGFKCRSAALGHARAASSAVRVKCHRTRPMSVDRHILSHNRLSRHLRPTTRGCPPTNESVP